LNQRCSSPFLSQNTSETVNGSTETSSEKEPQTIISLLHQMKLSLRVIKQSEFSFV
jgi:hypothetical protein